MLIRVCAFMFMFIIAYIIFLVAFAEIGYKQYPNYGLLRFTEIQEKIINGKKVKGREVINSKGHETGMFKIEEDIKKWI